MLPQGSYPICTCSGQVAVITPRQVISGLGVKTVTVIAVAKHHTIAATDGGEVYTWGSNRGLSASDFVAIMCMLLTFCMIGDTIKLWLECDFFPFSCFFAVPSLGNLLTGT